MPCTYPMVDFWCMTKKLSDTEDVWTVSGVVNFCWRWVLRVCKVWENRRAIVRWLILCRKSTERCAAARRRESASEQVLETSFRGTTARGTKIGSGRRRRCRDGGARETVARTLQKLDPRAKALPAENSHGLLIRYVDGFLFFFFFSVFTKPYISLCTFELLLFIYYLFCFFAGAATSETCTIFSQSFLRVRSEIVGDRCYYTYYHMDNFAQRSHSPFLHWTPVHGVVWVSEYVHFLNTLRYVVFYWFFKLFLSDRFNKCYVTLCVIFSVPKRKKCELILFIFQIYPEAHSSSQFLINTPSRPKTQTLYDKTNLLIKIIIIKVLLFNQRILVKTFFPRINHFFFVCFIFFFLMCINIVSHKIITPPNYTYMFNHILIENEHF